jgi:hypothetical protein
MGYSRGSSFKKMKRSGMYQASNNTFDPKTCEAHSYRHWLYVRKIRGKVVFNAYRYSSSTSAHQSAMRALLKELKIKIHLEVETGESLTRFEETALPYLYKKLFEIEMYAARKKIKADKSAVMKEIKLARSLGAKMSRAEIWALKTHMELCDKQRLEREREKRAARKKLEAGARLVEKSGEVFDPNAFTETEETSHV